MFVNPEDMSNQSLPRLIVKASLYYLSVVCTSIIAYGSTQVGYKTFKLSTATIPIGFGRSTNTSSSHVLIEKA